MPLHSKYYKKSDEVKFPVITGNLCLDEDYIMMKILWIIICICVSCHLWQNIDSECDFFQFFFI